LHGHKLWLLTWDLSMQCSVVSVCVVFTFFFFFLTGMHRHPFREQLGTLYDISSLSFDIYWTRPEEPYIYWVNKYSHNRMKRMFFSEYSRISLTEMLILCLLVKENRAEVWKSPKRPIRLSIRQALWYLLTPFILLSQLLQL